VTGSRGHVTVNGSTGYHGGGVVRIASGPSVSDHGASNHGASNHGGSDRIAEVAPHDVYRAQFEAFAAATAAGGQASASGDDGVAALGVADAVERSLAAGGAPVTVPLPFQQAFTEGVS
jgi:predicted dehydrogenase